MTTLCARNCIDQQS